jgi:hypothetical protein
VNARIGPYASFLSVAGGINPITTELAQTPTGQLAPGKPRVPVSVIVTVQETATTAAAWTLAAEYRKAIGAVADAIENDLGVVTPFALIADVEIDVNRTISGAVLTARWHVLPTVANADQGPAKSNPILAARALRRQPVDSTAANSSGTAVGLTAWDAVEGSIQPPITATQVLEVQEAATAIGADGVAAPARGGGRITTSVYAANLSGAKAYQKATADHAGRFVAVKVGGALIQPLGVVSVNTEVEKHLATNSASVYLVRAEWELGAEISGSVSYQVQVAEAWGRWETVEGAEPVGDEQACGAVAGSMQFSHQVGEVAAKKTSDVVGLNTLVTGAKSPPSLPARSVLPLTDHAGKWVRVAVVDGGTVTPIWHGRILSRSISTGRTGARVSYACSELISALAQVQLVNWYEVGQNAGAASGLSETGEVPVFNGQPDGDASVATFPAGVYTTRRVHARNGRADGTGARKWTALDVVTSLLAAYATEFTSAPVIRLGGQTDALGYSETWDLRNLSLADQLASVITPRRGVSFRLHADSGGEVADDKTWTLEVFTTTGSASAGQTVPANANTLALLDLSYDKNGGLLSDGVAFSESTVGQADRLYVEGQRPEIAGTFAFSLYNNAPAETRTLAKGWTDAEETAWKAASPAERAKEGLNHVWRRFVISPTWDGRNVTLASLGSDLSTVAGALLANDRSTTAGGIFNGGENGRQTFNAGNPRQRPAAMRFTRFTPFNRAVDYEAYHDQSYGAHADRPENGRADAQAFLYRKSPALFEPVSDRWQITFSDEGAAVIFGTSVDDAVAIQNELNNNKSLILTAGLEGVRPWRVSWKSSVAKDVPRVLRVPAPEIGFRFLAQGTIYGSKSSSGSSAPATVMDTSTNSGLPGATIGFAIDGATNRLDPVLELARLWHERPSRSLSWRVARVDVGRSKPPTLSEPPANATKGSTYTVGSGATGDWSGQDGRTATWSGAAWRFTPQATDACWVGRFVTSVRIPLGGASRPVATIPGGLITARRRTYTGEPSTEYQTEELQLGRESFSIGAAGLPVPIPPPNMPDLY